MRNWVKVIAVFDHDYDLGLDTPMEGSLEEFDFDLNEVVAYNQSHFKGFTSIWINNTTITINVPIKDFRKMIKKNDFININYRN